MSVYAGGEDGCLAVVTPRKWEWQIDGRANRLDEFNGKIKERVDSSFPSDFSGLAN